MKLRIRVLQISVLILVMASGADLYPGQETVQVRKEIVATAKKYIGVLYRYGGTGRGGFDCSGFVRFVYGKHGITLPRTSRDQYWKGERISLAQAEPGDLVFFKIRGDRVSHVGIYLGGLRFIHSPRTGRKVSVADMKVSYWHNRFAGAVRYLK